MCQTSHILDYLNPKLFSDEIMNLSCIGEQPCTPITNLLLLFPNLMDTSGFISIFIFQFSFYSNIFIYVFIYLFIC